jgi:hypothetical protein
MSGGSRNARVKFEVIFVFNRLCISKADLVVHVV